MAKKSEFNLSEVIRERRKSHRSEKATEALAAIQKAHPNQKINSGTFKSTYYKISGAKRTVRRAKPGRGGAEGGGVLPAALAFIRAAGSIAAAKEVLAELEQVKEL
ncbi:MAG TPA: hypothetical protein VFG04_03870 [Planctomycetaceae bacterium]|jgi:hypothetical protein|nr:hypothetical protein [Planctomycetaceae bacterium]